MKQLRLTPDMLEAAYELLRTTPPFKGWRLPSADDVEFHVTRHQNRYADYEFDKLRKVHIVRVSQVKNVRLDKLLETLAHEMIHMRQFLSGKREADHGALFQREANRICNTHGFDRAIF